MNKSIKLTIILTGGGSGGHITPLLAVASELKKIKPNAKLMYIGQQGDNLADIPAKDPNIDKCLMVKAGKFRRFHGEGIKQLFDLPILFKNARDFFYVIVGFFQCRSLLRKLKPDIIFIKGGFIGVPVGLAAASLHLPYITHDSDAIPGLANRIISRWASVHAVALPKELYNYPAVKTVTTGIPLQADFVPVDSKTQAKYRQSLRVPQNAKIIFVIGGGLGAQKVNSAVAEALPHLLKEFSDLYVFQSVGRANEVEVKEYYKNNLNIKEQGRVKVFGYLSDVYRYSGMADIVITRAGATNLAEFALQGKACIVIPNPLLTGGHQIKNSEPLSNRRAAILLSETDLIQDPNRLSKQVSELLRNPNKVRILAENLSTFAKPNATKDIAELILKRAEGQ